jgi:SH3-like domain-containing protein
VEHEGSAWVKVRAPDGKEGWVLQALLATATPAPNW